MSSSLSLQVLLYLTSFYFGMFVLLEIGLLIFKGLHLPYPDSGLWVDGIILSLLIVIETFRIMQGQKGNLLSLQGRVSMAVSLGLTFPSVMSVLYFALWQHFVLKLEIILCIILLVLQVIEFVFGCGVMLGQ